jgi:hypothetical protein
MTLEVFPIVFQQNRGWGTVVGSLPFLGLFIGVLAAVFINLANQPRYARIVDTANGKPVPEARLLPMAIGGFIFAIGYVHCPLLSCTFSEYKYRDIYSTPHTILPSRS